ncbi:hypothetical protein H7H48_15785 [Nitratireductor sp. B36]|uniref:hypothetical protein n=1 Tax=Nitratireductor sp. B36 TaxID=2762059 RepID=UPI001E290E29|nr:hypothetical protein [Nitratireductor sp. B36]MCC5780522.1 hypothetical protein [Nitratireductor sp. B36]
MRQLSLPFDHEVLKEKNGVALVQINDRNQTRYATYRTNKEGHAYWGNYTNNQAEAEFDFEKRANL